MCTSIVRWHQWLYPWSHMISRDVKSDNHLHHTHNISAIHLQDQSPPRNLWANNKLSISDRHKWNRSYLEECIDIHETSHIWEYISEVLYQKTRTIVKNILLIMRMSTIKKDEDSNPIRAKYYIMVLWLFKYRMLYIGYVTNINVPSPLHICPTPSLTQIWRFRPSLLSVIPY